jgi:hypothetical protein
MGKKLDKISIGLRVTAVQMKLDVWMQGDLEIKINGQKPYSESDNKIIEVENKWQHT